MNADNVVNLWQPDPRYTVSQALKVALKEEDIDSVIVVGEYDDGSLYVKSSRMTHAEANWLIDRAKNHVLHGQFGGDDHEQDD